MAENTPDIQKDHLFHYTVHLADDSLIMGHRLSEWTGHGPMLEQDIAISNIALDLIGQARNFYQYAASLQNKAAGLDNRLVTEDTLAYLRGAHEFKNVILAELPNGDWAKTVLKLFFFSSFQYLSYQRLRDSSDKQLSAIGEKSLKEVTYHLRWSSDWVIRLGDGTEESHQRLQAALDELWPYTEEMFFTSGYEKECIESNIAADVTTIKDEWNRKIAATFLESTVTIRAAVEPAINLSGKQGIHTGHLQEILSEMQYLQKTYPGCEW